MPHGQPLWQKAQSKYGLHQWADLDELAARLGSPVRFDRRGDVTYMDSFENGLASWYSDGTGDGNTVDLSAERSRTGLFSARVVAGKGAGAWAEIMRFLPFPMLMGLGFEVSFLVEEATGGLTFSFVVYDGTKQMRYKVFWDDVNNLLQYQGPTVAWTTFATGIIPSIEKGLFHTAKLVVDGATGYYKRFILDSLEYDLSTYQGYSPGDGALPRLYVSVSLDGLDGVNVTSYLDDVIVTHNEL